ncbi:MAG: hypothetical protein IPI78_05990 [Chitinophagaceae bacterium]|nr:hypothetical protein [Chitinophagaceae bacterium]
MKSTGIIRYVDNAGNTDSDPSGTYLTMENGSQYIIEKNGGSFPAGGLWNPNSLAKWIMLLEQMGPYLMEIPMAILNGIVQVSQQLFFE